MFSNQMSLRCAKVTMRYFAVFLMCSLSAPLAFAQQPIDMGPGEQHVLAFRAPLTKVSASNPDVVSVTASAEDEVLVTAEGPGSAAVRVWLEGQTSPQVTEFNVSRLLGGRRSISSQVQTDIRIVEVNRSELNTLGVYYSKLFNGGSQTIALSPPGAGGFRGFGPSAGGTGITTEGFNLFSFGSSSLSIINALESGGFAYTLAEPSLVSLSGQTATFLSGGEFPIPVSSDNGEVEIEFKEFGVSLALTPTVVSDDEIILKVAPEVSELDFTSGVSTGGVAVPGLRIRRTQTTVTMAPGESFIISGLVSRATTNRSDRIPGLGNLPIIGAFFRSDRVASEDKELIMVVTPKFVSAQKQLPREARNFGKAYEQSSTEWLDMVTNGRDGDEPIESGLSW